MKKYLDYELVLGGGGSRGFAHIGALSVLEKIKRPSLITGCSMGAIIGAIYAIHGNAPEVYKILDDLIFSKQFQKFRIEKATNIFSKYILINVLYRRKYLISQEKVHEILGKAIPSDLRFEDLSIPLRLNTFNMKSGKSIMIDSGNVLNAVAASSAIPGIVEPFRENGNILVDGGVSGSIPFSFLDNNTRKIVIDVGFRPEGKEDFANALEIFYRSLEWQLYFFEKNFMERFRDYDDRLFIIPHVKTYSLKDFNRLPEISEKGKIETEKMKKNIGEFLRPGLWKRFFI